MFLTTQTKVIGLRYPYVLTLEYTSLDTPKKDEIGVTLKHLTPHLFSEYLYGLRIESWKDSLTDGFTITSPLLYWMKVFNGTDGVPLDDTITKKTHFLVH